MDLFGHRFQGIVPQVREAAGWSTGAVEEAFGSIAPAVRRQKKLQAGTQLAHSFICISAQAMLLPSFIQGGHSHLHQRNQHDPSQANLV